MSRKATTLHVNTGATHYGHTTEVWQVSRNGLQFQICCAPGGFSAAYREYGANLGRNFCLVTDLGNPAVPGSQVLTRELVAAYRDTPQSRRTSRR